MSLSDPFSTTAQLAQEGVGGGIQAAVDPMIAQAQRKQQQQQTANMLRQSGLIRDEEQPYTLQELQPFAKKLGVEIKSDPSIPESEQVNNILGLAKAHNIEIPSKKKTVLDLAGMATAGIQLNPNTGEMIMAPKKPEKTIYDAISEMGIVEKAKQEGSLPEGTEYKGGKLQTKGAGGTGGVGSTITFAEKNAPSIAAAYKSGDYGILDRVDARTRSATTRMLAEEGVNITEPTLGYKAKQSTMGNAKIMDQKVNAGISAQTLLDSSYDPQSGQYKVPPSMHTELALAVARLISPTGVVAQELVDELRQKTAQEGLAGAAIFLGFDPKEVGGSTQSVINLFAKTIDREASVAEDMRDKYLSSGKPSSFREFKKSNKSSVTDVAGLTSGVPSVGSSFNGQKVTKVTRIQ